MSFMRVCHRTCLWLLHFFIIHLNHSGSQILETRNTCKLAPFCVLWCVLWSGMSSHGCRTDIRCCFTNRFVSFHHVLKQVSLHLLIDVVFILFAEPFLLFAHMKILKHFSEARVVWLRCVSHITDLLAEKSQVIAILICAHARQRKTFLISFDEFHFLFIDMFYVKWYLEQWQIIAR